MSLTDNTRSLSLLPPPVRAKIRSTQILTSLPQVISELVQNSLDANAHHIEVGVDREEWECWVKDDGEGMSKESMGMLRKAEEEGRYNTSKTYAPPPGVDTPSTFGFRGEALASAVDVSCLEISSRTSRSRQSWALIMKNGQCLYEGPAVRWRRETPGTVVCLRDIFYNLPIRRISHPNPSKTLDLIQKEIQSFALVFPEVSFSVEDTHKAREVGSERARITSIPKTRSMLATFRHIYGRALVEHVEDVDIDVDEVKIRGFISLYGAHSRSHQYLYVNRHLLSPSSLHRLIEDLFLYSSFTKNALDEAGATSLPRPASRRSPRKSERRPVYVLNLTLPPRTVDNGFEPSKSTVQFANNDTVTTILTSLIRSFLIKHGFLSAKSNSRTNTNIADVLARGGSPRKRQKLNPDVENEHARDMAERRPRSASAAISTTNVRTRENNDGSSRPGSATEPVIHTPSSMPVHDQAEPIIWTDPHTKIIYLVDPRTGNSYPRDSNNATDDNPQHIQEPGFTENRSGRRTLVDRRWLKSNILGDEDEEKDAGGKETPEWIVNALKANNIYAPSQPSIKHTHLDLPTTSCSAPSPLTPHHHDHAESPHTHKNKRSRFFDSHPSSSSFRPNLSQANGPHKSHRFRREDLKKAEVIAQVDRKFVVCCIDERVLLDSNVEGDDGPEGRRGGSEHGRALVLIDQHAASERVRVERFLKRICVRFLTGSKNKKGEGKEGDGIEEEQDEVMELEPPKPVLLTTMEVEILREKEDVRALLSRWGIDVLFGEGEVGVEKDKNVAYGQVWVKSVPEVVVKKLLAGNELQELIKGFLASVENDEIPGTPPAIGSASVKDNESDSTDDFWWQKALRWCPRGLLDLVNSRACRGAIMFNDTLNLEQCERLLTQLSDTAYPFQCAHGRPSLVPLMSMSRFEPKKGGRARFRRRRQRGEIQWERLGLYERV